MAFIAYCYSWPCWAPALVLPVLRYIINTWTYTHTHYLHIYIQTNKDVYRQHHSVLHTFDELAPFILSHSSHTEESAILLVRAFLDSTSQMVMIAGLSLSWLTPLTWLVKVWNYNMCDKLQYVWQICVLLAHYCVCADLLRV